MLGKNRFWESQTFGLKSSRHLVAAVHEQIVDSNVNAKLGSGGHEFSSWLVKHTVDKTEGNATGYACLRITNYYAQMMEGVLRRYFFTGNWIALTRPMP